ncbi:MAG TPA: hypothetical protein DDZ89_05950 [Clostridiales bacterium]|nr:hypothetical protein [Clostridiales bacterium]
MDLFNEKIVKKNYDYKDAFIVLALILVAFLLFFLTIFLNLTMALPIVLIGIGYGLFQLISARHVEFEYSVTNGDMDVDKIIAKRKRVRVFSVEGKNLEMLAKLKSDKYTGDFQSISQRVEAVSFMENDDVYFLVAPYKGNRTILFFEPNERMLQDFRKKAPRNVFIS